jgi:hypothetical protein
MFFDRIKLVYFICAFAFGLFLTYISAPAPEIVIKFPSPYNSGKITYKDKSNTCYKYEAIKSQCPMDQSLIKKQPLNLEEFKLN